MEHRLAFALFVEERLDRRVRVAVSVQSLGGEEVHVDTLTVQLATREGDPLGPSRMLPVSGQVQGTLLSSVEVRSNEELPEGCRVLGALWAEGQLYETHCEADPGPALESHVLGRTPVRPKDRGHVLKGLSDAERAQLTSVFPWLNIPMFIDDVMDTEEVTPTPQGSQAPEDEEVDAFCAEMGLCDADAELLKEILGEDL